MMAEPITIVKGEIIKNNQRKQKYPEVLFPRFTSITPWKDPANFYQGRVTIPITRLSHITHNIEARNIHTGNGQFKFTPKPKLGKQLEWDGSPRGITYIEVDDNKYKEIPRLRSNPVLPGYLSWWGIDTRKPDIMEQVRANKVDRCKPPPYLSDPPGSSYGNKAFSITLEDILADYKRSRDDQQGANACLKGCGTLRYEHEICYVIMVCMEGDNVEDDTFDINNPQFDPNGIINLKGMVNRQGIVVDPRATPSFYPQSIVNWSKGNNYDWENLAFCFYYPERQLRLICNKITVSDIMHNSPPRSPPCTSTLPDPDNPRGKWKCPNELWLAKKH